MTPTIELGQKVRDAVTGFTGVVTGRCEYLYGVTRVQVTSEELNSEGKIVDNWFDEPQLAAL